MTYEKLCKMIIRLCETLYDNAIDEMDEDETTITLGATLDDEYKIEITITKEAINNGE